MVVHDPLSLTELSSRTSVRLSAEQRRIAEHLDGGLLVRAPAGCGKTTVLTARLANVIEVAGHEPERILCLTFTNRAARAIRDRLRGRYPEHASRVAPRTFHHLCVDILREEARTLGLAVDFTICDQDTSIGLLGRILTDARRADEERDLYHRLGDVKARARLETLSWPVDYERLYAGLRDGHPRAVPRPPNRWREAALKYQRGLADWQALDFGDLLLLVRALFATSPEARERWAGRYDLIQVDEAQDILQAEFEIVEMLAERSGNLALFGDANQSIYEWRGANPRALRERFLAAFPNAIELELAHNYRATRRLVSAASAFAGSFAERGRVDVPEASEDGEQIRFHVARDVGDEMAWMAERVRDLAGGQPYRQVGVLSPMNWQCAVAGQALDRLGIPHLTAERMLLSSDPVVREVLACLRLLLNPADSGAALGAWPLLSGGAASGALAAIKQVGARVGLRLSDLLRFESHADGDPLGALLRAYRAGRLVVFDVETTGTVAGRDEVVEIAAARLVGGRRTEEFQAVIRNTVPVGDSARIHKLDDAFLAANGRPAAEAFAAFDEFRGDDLLVGHNVAFDVRLVAAHAALVGRPPFCPRVADTLDLARRFVRTDSYALASLAERLDLAHRPAHRALADVLATSDLLGELVARAEETAEARRAVVAVAGAPLRLVAARLDGWFRAARAERPAAVAGRVIAETGLADRVDSGCRRHLERLVRTFAERDELALDPLSSLREVIAVTALARSLDHLDDGEDLVPVITIHQAKGLEFDTVFVVGLAAGSLPRRRSTAEGRDDEERRLFYVALTRARSRLFLSAPAYDGRGPAERSPFLKQIDRHLVPWR